MNQTEFRLVRNRKETVGTIIFLSNLKGSGDVFLDMWDRFEPKIWALEMNHVDDDDDCP